MTFTLRPIEPGDRERIARFMVKQWGADDVVSKDNRRYQPSTLPGFIAVEDGEIVGLITYHREGGACEVVTIDSLREGTGIGTALIEAVIDAASEAGCSHLWLITTNDNMRALRFYQRRGFELAALHRNAMDGVRALKPSVPHVGMDGIPLRDTLELERSL